MQSHLCHMHYTWHSLTFLQFSQHISFTLSKLLYFPNWSTLVLLVHHVCFHYLSFHTHVDSSTGFYSCARFASSSSCLHTVLLSSSDLIYTHVQHPTNFKSSSAKLHLTMAANSSMYRMETVCDNIQPYLTPSLNTSPCTLHNQLIGQLIPALLSSLIEQSPWIHSPFSALSPLTPAKQLIHPVNHNFHFIL